MNEGVVWDFSGMSDDFPIKKDFLDYSHELSNRRMTMIYYYRGTFSFKKRLKDKTYIKKDYLRGFIPIRGVFQYSIRRSSYRTDVSKYLDENSTDEKIILIGKPSRKRIIYREEQFESSIKELLLGHMGDKRLRCKYLLFGICNNKMVCLSFPIQVYLELEKMVDIADIINNGYSMDIMKDILDFSFDCLDISTKRYVIDDTIKSKVNNIIHIHNQRVEGRYNSRYY